MSSSDSSLIHKNLEDEESEKMSDIDEDVMLMVKKEIEKFGDYLNILIEK